MPIMAAAAPMTPELTQEVVAAVMEQQRAHCAPSTWDKFVRSLRANKFSWDTTSSLT